MAKSLAPRRISDKLIDLLAEKEALPYRRGIVKGKIDEFKKAGDEKMVSIYQNRYNELVKLEAEIKADIFAECRRLYNEF